MCGIAGVIGPNAAAAAELVASMTEILGHRGPDGAGIVVSIDRHAAIGMNTLAIVAPDGEIGPYCDPVTGCVLAYNGEIYNFRELALKWDIPLAPHETDAHLVLRAYTKLGAGCIDSFDGMFAIALYDPRSQRGILARDPLGEKPLYYMLSSNRVIFASETKALLAEGLPEISAPPHWLALETLLDSNTPYQGIRLLEPGCFIEFKSGATEIRPKQYWSLSEIAINPPSSYSEALATFAKLLIDAAHSRVPVVSFALMLSGGLDSAVLAYLMKPDFLITVRYPGQQQLDELINAQMVADDLGIELVCIEPKPEDFIKSARGLVGHLDYPLGNASLFSELMLYREAQRLKAKVVVGGLGPDELLLGYVRHSLLLDGPSAIDEMGLDTYQSMTDKFVHRSAGKFMVAERYLQEILRGPDIDPSVRESVYEIFRTAGDVGKALTLCDLKLIFPALVLASDKLASAFGIERRSPYLARELVEFCYALPIEYKRAPGRTKLLLRDTASRIGVPEQIWASQNKIGFASPLPVWLTGELGNWCRGYLESTATSSEVPALIRLAVHRALAVKPSPFDRSRMQALLMALWWSQHAQDSDARVIPVE
jgi:asparagine synthase (glutamine-hydrolysing)